MNTNCALIEAVLSLEAEPIDEENLSRLTGLDREEVIANLDILRDHYNSETHGIELLKFPNGWTFAPKDSLWGILRAHYGKGGRGALSRAALETLSIIAYSQPIARSEIENIRGVGVDGVIRALTDRDLIKEIGRKETPGRAILYGTTRKFLKRFNLKSIAELPKLDEIENKKFFVDGDP